MYVLVRITVGPTNVCRTTMTKCQKVSHAIRDKTCLAGAHCKAYLAFLPYYLAANVALHPRSSQSNRIRRHGSRRAGYIHQGFRPALHRTAGADSPRGSVCSCS